MTQVGEAVKAAGISARFLKCPFNEPEPPDDPDEENADYAFDDSVTMSAAQANSPSKLGTNLKNGSPGTSGTWNVIGGDPPRRSAPQGDTERDPANPMVKVEDEYFPFTVAAHHIIPGDASLFKSDLFKHYMRRGGKMEITTPEKSMTFTVSRNIGYNVNGSHNGVWLAGSYAIRTGIHPTKLTWSLLIENPSYIDWCHQYIAAVTRVTNHQFHDSHTAYNNNVLKVLDRLWEKLARHQARCPECEGRTKTPPPYLIKRNLYRLSAFLLKKIKLGPQYWAGQHPWMTSDQVKVEIMNNPQAKAKFRSAYYTK